MYSYTYTDTCQEFLVEAQMTSEVCVIYHPMVEKYEIMKASRLPKTIKSVIPKHKGCKKNYGNLLPMHNTNIE